MIDFKTKSQFKDGITNQDIVDIMSKRVATMHERGEDKIFMGYFFKTMFRVEKEAKKNVKGESEKGN